MKLSIIGILLILAVNMAGSAQSPEERKRQFVVAPRNVVLQVVAVQPGCPIRLENVSFLVGVSGGGSNVYDLRNVGSKPVRRVTVASSTGAINTYESPPGSFHTGTVLYLSSRGQCSGCTKDEILTLTPELREKLGLGRQMKSIITLMILEVEFEDGSRFSDRETFEAMSKFLDRLDSALQTSQRRSGQL